MVTALSNISSQQLRRALVLKEQIESLEQELSGILGNKGGLATRAIRTGRRRRRGQFSPEARERIAAAQRARWAKHRAKKGLSGTAARRRRPRKMSAAARARIAAAQRARWAAFRASKR
jgi:hypothetical protein